MVKAALIHVNYQIRDDEDVLGGQLTHHYATIDIPLTAFLPRNGGLRASFCSLMNGDKACWDAWLQREKPDFFHLHNIHSSLNPAFLRWIRVRQIPAIATIHNHLFYCTNGLALYAKETCKACLRSELMWRPLLKNCNRKWKKSAYHSLALTQFKIQNLLNESLRRFLATSPYMEAKMVQAGLPTPSRSTEAFQVRLRQIIRHRLGLNT